MTHETAVVANVFAGRDADRDCLFVELQMQMLDGCYQAFALTPPDIDKKHEAVSALCSLFKVSDLQDVRSKICTILRSWPDRHAPIEGLQVGGRRFTVSAFEKTSAIERKRRSLAEQIASARRHLAELEGRLANLSNEYVDWECHP
jgi:hypothetical protein